MFKEPSHLQHQPEPKLEVDYPIEAPGDSDYEGGEISDTLSLCSSLNEHIEQNGRRYHTYWGPNKNPMPSDSAEKERLNIVHEFTLIICGNRTGVWSIDYAQDHPHAEILGIDISPIQPAWVPPNCTFEIDDFEAEWNYKPPFDFIYARTIAQSVTNWPKLLNQAMTHLQPGGWIELAEYSLLMHCDDDSMPVDWPPAVAFQLIQKAMTKLGREFPDHRELKGKLEKAGFVDVGVKTLKLPVGPWPKDPAMKQAGSLALATTSGYEAYGLQMMTTVLGIPDKEAAEICARAAEAHADKKVHPYTCFYSVWGRKPE